MPPPTPAVSSLRSIVVSVYTPTVLFGIGQGAMTPIVVLSARELGASVGTAGLIVALLGIGNLLGDIPAGALAARVGDRRAMLLAAVLILAALTGCVTANSVWLLGLSILTLGIASATWMIARHTYLTEAVPYQLRARAMSTLGGCMRIGAFLGPFLGAAVMAGMGTSGGYWVHLVAAAAAALLVAIVKDPARHGARGEPDAGSGHTWTILRRSLPVYRTLGLGVLTVGAVRASRQVVIPLWAEHIGLDPVTTSIIFGLAGVVDMVLFYPAGKVMDVWGRTWVAVPCMLILALSHLLLPLTSHTWSLIAVAVLMGIGNGMGSGIIMTLGSDASPTSGRAAFLGGWRLCGDLGTAGGPLLLSGVTMVFALGPAVLTMAAVGVLGAGAMAHWIPRVTGRP